jgi:hypothetical protein
LKVLNAIQRYLGIRGITAIRLLTDGFVKDTVP